ncbi:DUF885 domain-containing protein [Oleisolibacter albus]|uniref:DUF885 domain-containing protein n=1 Tax=Oleisolibacter albus TaxID=2171757 RepID=UPI00138FFE5C|nr:DUF885 domain-containing protein [Oleisolibacter albus]
MSGSISRRGFLAGSGGLGAAALAGWPAFAASTAEDKRLLDFVQAAFEQEVARHPETRTWLGLPGPHDAWDDISPRAEAEEARMTEAHLGQIRAFDPARLSPAGRLNRHLFEYRALDRLDGFRWSLNSYPAEHFNGRHGSIVDMLSSVHPASSPDLARAWIARVRGVPAAVDQLMEALEIRAARGVIPPRFSVDKTLEATRAVLTGRPFGDGPEDSALLAGFTRRVKALDLPEAERTALVAEAGTALARDFAPAWQRLAACFDSLRQRTSDDDGIWKLPDGLAYYRSCLKRHTTLDLEPEALHALGLAHVAALQKEMQAIQDSTGFTGTVREFHAFLKEDPRFYFPDTDEGRAAYLAGAERILAGVKAVLGSQFGLLPKTDLVARRFELYREASETLARYSPPAADGSRPGIYFINLSRLREMPKWQMEVLAFHEGIPGHHLQMALAQEMTDLPAFRRFDGHNAYIEGWALYSERLPKELGFYTDPYADYGRLTFELWRAIRLVVDTGIHVKRWTRQQAIDYFTANSAFTAEVAEREVDRYIVFPGQACAYRLGLLKILELREHARTALGPRFDIRGFHDTLLRHGSVPLPVLEETVEGWIRQRKA